MRCGYKNSHLHLIIKRCASERKIIQRQRKQLWVCECECLCLVVGVCTLALAALQLPLCNALCGKQLLACAPRVSKSFWCGSNFNATLPIASRCAAHFFCDTFKRHATSLPPSLPPSAMHRCMCNVKWNVKGKSTFLTRCSNFNFGTFLPLLSPLSLFPITPLFLLLFHSLGKVHLKVAATKRKLFN